MRETINSILLNIAVSDAFSSQIDGLSRGHIHSVLGTVRSYVDTHEAFKKRPDKWKKPGLYTFITQASVLLSYFTAQKGFTPGQFFSFINGLPETPGCDLKIFRHSGLCVRKSGEKNCRIRNNLKIIAPCAALCFSGRETEELIKNTIELVSFFCGDESTLSGSILVCLMIDGIIRRGADYRDIFSIGRECAAELKQMLPELSPFIFEKGLNPNPVSSELSMMEQLFRRLEKTRGLGEAEKTITEAAAENGYGIKTASVSHAPVLIPYSIAILREHASEPGEIIFTAANSGGPCSVTSAITGAFSAVISGPSVIDPELLNGMINKKFIRSLIEKTAYGRADIRDINGFIESEKALSGKELEEYRALNKRNEKKAASGTKKQRKTELIQNLHVVESWTKEDRAKWKKSLKKQGKNKNI